MGLDDHARTDARNSNKMLLSATSTSIRDNCHVQRHRNTDPFDITEMKLQLEEISSAPMPPKYKPMHQVILNQINARLNQINVINTVKGGAYEDVCKFYKEIGIFAATAKNHEIQAANAVAAHDNLPIAEHPSEARFWKARSDALDFD